MRRGKKTNIFQYINVRVEQLKEEREKTHNELDKMWYTRMIQELSWVKDPKHNCYKNRGDILGEWI